MGTKIVVIIPYYNGKEFVGRCLTSIANQTYKNIDIIMVDDGSNDDSFCEVNKYKDKINLHLTNIRFPSNKGVSAARNEGLRIARLEYNSDVFVAFIDIDDYLANDYFSTLISMCETYGADVSCTSLLYATKYGNFKHKLFDDRDDTPLVMDNFNSVYNLLKDHKITSWIPTKMFKLSVFDGVSFPEDIRGYEDRATAFKLFINSNKVVFSNYCGYFYNQISTNSITRSEQQNDKKLVSLESYLRCITFDYSRYYSRVQCNKLIQAAKEGYINVLLMVIGNFDYDNKDEIKRLKYYEKKINFLI